MLLRRYHTLDFMNELDLYEFIEFIMLAKKKDMEERLFMQWCAMLPNMSKYMAFDEFKDTLTGANIDRRSSKDIISEIEQAHGMKEGELYGHI